MKNTEVSLNVTVHYQAHQGVSPWAKPPQQEPTSQGEIVNILLKIKNSFLPTKQILIGL